MLNLCSHWLDRKDDVFQPTVTEEGEHQEEATEDSIEEVEEIKDEVIDDYVPPPRCPTTWTVRLSSEEERKLFQVCFKKKTLYIKTEKSLSLFPLIFFSNKRRKGLRILIKLSPTECMAMKV